MNVRETELYAWFGRACALEPAERERLLAEVARRDVRLALELGSLLLADERVRARQERGPIRPPRDLGPLPLGPG